MEQPILPLPTHSVADPNTFQIFDYLIRCINERAILGHCRSYFFPFYIPGEMKVEKQKRMDPAKADEKRRRIWAHIVKKEIPRAVKQRAAARAITYTNLKCVSRDW